VRVTVSDGRSVGGFKADPDKAVGPKLAADSSDGRCDLYWDGFDGTNTHRLSIGPLCGGRNCSRSREFQSQPTENRQVSVEPDTLDATDAEHRQCVVMLQPSELALDG
jgi:hypothetical protein